MDHIPVEVLHEIFIKLDLEDKLKCMFACRFWYDTLDRLTLLYHLSVNKTQLVKLKDMLEHFPHRAAHTEYLTVQNNPGPSFDKRELCNMFPNLRELILKEFHQNHTSGPFYHETFHFTHPTSKLERIEDCGECELTRQLVISNLCGRLKSLKLNLSYAKQSVRNSTIPQLKSMPVLEHLGLIGPAVTLMDLELLHHNLPTIKSLQLNVHFTSGDTPRDVVPATLITKLEMTIYSANNISTHIQLYKYANNKYPFVNKPVFDDSALWRDNMEHIRDVYNEGIFPIYQRLGSQIDTFSFDNYYNELDAFKKFDAFGMKLKELTIGAYREEVEEDTVLSLGELAQSQKSKSIKKLTLTDIIPKPMDWMNNMESLTYLEISTNYDYENHSPEYIKTIDFTQLIEASPATLIQLKLSGLDLTFNEATLNQTCIKCLDLSYVDLDQQLANVIETSFPQLVQLRFDGVIKNQVTISLPKNNLDILYIKLYYYEIENSGFVLKTANDSIDKYYAIRQYADDDGKGTIHCYSKFISVSKEEFHYNSTLSLTCASCKESTFYAAHNFIVD